MLFPFILFTAVWANLHRPMSQAEADAVCEAQRWCNPTNPAAAFYRLRGRVLAAQLQPGMAAREVQRILGHRPQLQCADVDSDELVSYYVLLGVRVRYNTHLGNAAKGPRPGDRIKEVGVSSPTPKGLFGTVWHWEW